MRLLIALTLNLIVLCGSVAYAQTSPAKTMTVTKELPLIVGSGHGSLFAPDGTIIPPSQELIARTVQQYLDQARRDSNEGVLEKLKSIEETIIRSSDDLKLDTVIRDSIILDWLLEQNKNENAERISATNTAMRKAYFKNVLKINLRETPLHYNTGLPLDTLKNFNDLGIAKFAITGVDSEEYVKLCRDQGVPIPPTWEPENENNKDRGDWRFIGTQNLNFASSAPVSEVYAVDTGTQGEPNGLCIALPRIQNGEIGLLGVICHSRENGKACFWDNESIALDEQVELSEFIGGNDLPGGGNTCSDCHAGENPYVVHPGTAIDLGAAQDSPVWHEPLVPASWPQNPGPTSLLNFIPLGPNDEDCRQCHVQNDAGRFPEVGELSLYCSTVLTNALNVTMPGNDPAFAIHANALRAFCNQPPPDGMEVPVEDPKENKEFISAPIIVEPLYACASAVEVRGAFYGAKVTIFIDDIQVAQSLVTEPSQQIVSVPSLITGQKVVAVQEKDGLVSEPGLPVIVRDHTLDYPMGLPSPTIDPTLVHECGRVIAVRHIRGADVTVFTNGGSDATFPTGGEWTNLPPAIRPFLLGDTYTAQQSMCADKSDISQKVEAVAPPSPMPIPTTDPVFEGQELVAISNLAHGARTDVFPSGGGITSFSTAVSWQSEVDIASANGGPISSGQSIGVVSSLCDDVKFEFPQPQSCERLPAPTIAPPFVGNVHVDILSSVTGAQIIVFDESSAEIGHGSGAQVALNRPVVAGDVLTVIQRLGPCVSSTGYQISALCTNTNQGC